jgi:hypothetical protein
MAAELSGAKRNPCSEHSNTRRHDAKNGCENNATTKNGAPKLLSLKTGCPCCNKQSRFLNSPVHVCAQGPCWCTTGKSTTRSTLAPHSTKQGFIGVASICWLNYMHKLTLQHASKTKQGYGVFEIVVATTECSCNPQNLSSVGAHPLITCKTVLPDHHGCTGAGW